MMDAEPCRICGADGDAGCACGPGRVAPWPHPRQGSLLYEGAARGPLAGRHRLPPADAEAWTRWMAADRTLRLLAGPPSTAFTTTPAGRLVLVTP